jgi:hypothetical protein
MTKVTRYNSSGDGARKLHPAILIVSLAAVSIAVGAAFSLGLFGESEPESVDPLRITLSSDRLDFGDVQLHGVATRQLILRNDGDRPLTAELVVDDESVRVRPERLILHPGVGSRVEIELSGEEIGDLSDALRVVVDEPGRDPLLVALTGRVQQDAPRPSALEASRSRRSAGGDAQAGAGERTGAASPTEASRSTEPTGRDSRGERPTRIAANLTEAGQEAGVAAQGTGSATVSGTTRRPEASGDATRSRTADRAANSASRNPAIKVLPYDPATSAPVRSLAEPPPPVPDQISEEEAANANRIPSKTDGEELPETLPDEPYDDDDDRERDMGERREDDDDPFVSPTLTISGQSIVRVLGHEAGFYPQAIDVLGTDMGGPLNLLGPVDFPVVPLAFGGSILFAQLGVPASGGWDARSGQVTLQIPIQAVDADGDAAPMQLVLTTGTAMERNQAGAVVAISGTPRDPRSGICRLVGISKIPVGFKNNGEQHLVIVEILASLTFGTSISSSDPAPIGRIGG